MGNSTSRQLEEIRFRLNAIEHSNTQLNEMQQKYDDLHSKYETLLQEKNIPNVEPINNVAIADFVEQMLADPNVNIYYLPDIAEKQLYTNVLKMFLNLIQKSAENLKIQFIGHELKISLVKTPSETADE